LQTPSRSARGCCTRTVYAQLDHAAPLAYRRAWERAGARPPRAASPAHRSPLLPRRRESRMPAPHSDDITALLQAWGRGDKAALGELLPLVYGELRRQAERHMRAQPEGHTLQTTALVHEAYLRLVNQERVEMRNRAQFFALAGTAMRSILVDHARA